MQNESVVLQQRQRIGRQLIEARIPQPHRRLFAARALLLAKDVGNILGAEGVCLVRLGHRTGDGIRAVEYRSYTVAYCPTCQTGGKVLADNTTSKFLK